MTKTSKVAVIGLGNIGQVVATNLSRANKPFIVADRNAQKTSEFAAKLGESAVASDIPTAIKEATMIVLAIPFGAIASFTAAYAGDLEGKIIIDPSNPIAPDGNGGFKKIIDAGESAGEINARLLPKNAKLAKALGTLAATSLAGAANQSPEKSVLFYATDETTINAEVEQLIKDNGFDPVRVGGIDQSIRIEVFGDLHEFGALGKTVTLSEAQARI